MADGVTPKNAVWYIKTAEFYIEKAANVRLKDQCGEDVARYLVNLIKKYNLKEWQYIRNVEAILILFQKMIEADWAKDFPWDKWKEPHINFPEKLELYSGEDELWRPVVDTENFRDTLKGGRWRELFAKYFDKLRTEIRKKHYSIRTEKTYEEWIARFLTFHELKDPVMLNASHAKEYLDYLANVRRISASTQNQALCSLVFFLEEGFKC